MNESLGKMRFSLRRTESKGSTRTLHLNIIQGRWSTPAYNDENRRGGRVTDYTNQCLVARHLLLLYHNSSGSLHYFLLKLVSIRRTWEVFVKIEKVGGLRIRLTEQTVHSIALHIFALITRNKFKAEFHSFSQDLLKTGVGPPRANSLGGRGSPLAILGLSIGLWLCDYYGGVQENQKYDEHRVHLDNRRGIWSSDGVYSESRTFITALCGGIA